MIPRLRHKQKAPDPPEMPESELKRDIELTRKELLTWCGIFAVSLFLLLLPNLLYG